MAESTVEPWLRGTLGEVDAVRRGVLHALELAAEDAERWCAGLSDEEMELRPFELPSVGFQLRHVARSLDRLLTYAEGRQLSEAQMRELRSEMLAGMLVGMVAGDGRAEFRWAVARSMERVRAIAPGMYEEVREVGRARLPSTVGGLLVHCAEHTQRHVGQMVTTAKVVMAMRGLD